MPSSFTPRERELIRRELCRHFGQDPSVADGIFLRAWRAGPHRGEPKVPPAVQGLLDRGLVEIGRGRYGSRALFTEAGLRELRVLLQDRRAMAPERFAHLRRELGLDAGGGRMRTEPRAHVACWLSVSMSGWLTGQRRQRQQNPEPFQSVARKLTRTGT